MFLKRLFSEIDFIKILYKLILFCNFWINGWIYCQLFNKKMTGEGLEYLFELIIGNLLFGIFITFPSIAGIRIFAEHTFQHSDFSNLEKHIYPNPKNFSIDDTNFEIYASLATTSLLLVQGVMNRLSY